MNAGRQEFQDCLIDGGRLLIAADFDQQDEFLELGSDRSRLRSPGHQAVIEAASTNEVAAIVRLALQNNQPLRIAGGRTGLVGGAIAGQDEIVVSLKRMDHILGYDSNLNALELEAGVITAHAETRARELGMRFPIDLAASGSSQVGGNIATHAGGNRVVYNGLLRHYIVGLTVVTGTGEILELNETVLKNNTGYPLLQLFIGSEGTLGVITKARIRLTPGPRDLKTALFALNHPQAAFDVLHLFENAGVPLQAFEFFDELACQLVCSHLSIKPPFVLHQGAAADQSQPAGAYVLVEWDGAEVHSDQMMSVFEQIEASFPGLPGRLADNSRDRADLWRYRESISESISMEFLAAKNDISIPLDMIPEFIANLGNWVAAIVQQTKSVDDTDLDMPDLQATVIGHLADGTLHINLLGPAVRSQPDQNRIIAFQQAAKSINEKVYNYIYRNGGSISAEHGIGILKREALMQFHDAATMQYMRAIKQVFDPGGILNPGVLFVEASADERAP
ncbi:MAG: FAD-binding oxidoreductase [Leptospiraceae bacterium]|nr:FAD-binding oxidoreductase [Leptospiraceae bacterium]